MEVVESSWVESINPYLRGVNEKGRIYPNGKRVEVVFIVEALNLLLLRTEGPGDINEATLPESRLTVPVIQPQKLMAVVRRRLLQVLRSYRDAGADLKQFIEKAKKLGFTKAEEHLANGWNCTIQPPLAQAGREATDLGMDGYCPACTIFGVALTSDQFKALTGDMSLGLKTRVHFDPAFATTRKVQPETHNKVTEGTISTTGGALFTDIHVMPGTVFIGRATLNDLTLPELLAVLYSLATIEEIGGRAGVYGTIRVKLLGIRGGVYSVTSALELADEIASKNLERPSEIVEYLKGKLEELGFNELSNDLILEAVKPEDKDGVLKKLWESSIEYVSQVKEVIKEIRGESREERSGEEAGEEAETTGRRRRRGKGAD